MENSEGLVGAIAEVALQQNLREDYIRNEFVIKVTDRKDPFKYENMENLLNYIYTGFKKNKMKELTNLTPGKIVAAMDHFKDHIGRFKRTLIIPPPKEEADFSKEESLGNRGFVFCKLIDEGTMRTFPASKLYSLLDKFVKIPPRALTVQLMDLAAFHGSSTFGRHLEALLSRFPSQDLIITKVIENPQPGGPFLVRLYSVEMKQTLNHILLRQLCSPSHDNYTETVSDPGDTTSIFPGSLTHFNRDGEVWLRYDTPISSVVESCLGDIQNEWDPERLRYQIFQEIFIGDGSISVGMHPQKRRMCRCRIVDEKAKMTKPRQDGDSSFCHLLLSGRPLCKRSVRVQWIDWGDENEVYFEDLLPGRSCSRPSKEILETAKPQAIKYHLANIEFLDSNSYFLNRIRSTQSKITVKVLSSSSSPREVFCSSSGSKTLQVELFVNRLPRGSLQSRVKSLNSKLLKLVEAQPQSGAILITFPSSKYVQSTGLCRFPTELKALDWLYKPGPSADLNTVLKPGDKIAFYTGEASYSTTSGERLTIHPWATKELYDLLKTNLRHYFKGNEWIVLEDRLRFERRLPPPAETFCAYSRSEEWYRAKIIKKVNREDSSPNNAAKFLENQLVELLLLDEGKYVTAEFSSVAKIFPLPDFLTLGPQGAWVQLKSSKMLKSTSSGAKDDHKEKKKMKDALERRIRNLDEKQMKIVAVIEDIQRDSNGRVYLSLLLHEDSEN